MGKEWAAHSPGLLTLLDAHHGSLNLRSRGKQGTESESARPAWGIQVATSAASSCSCFPRDSNLDSLISSQTLTTHWKTRKPVQATQLPPSLPLLWGPGSRSMVPTFRSACGVSSVNSSLALAYACCSSMRRPVPSSSPACTSMPNARCHRLGRLTRKATACFCFSHQCSTSWITASFSRAAARPQPAGNTRRHSPHTPAALPATLRSNVEKTKMPRMRRMGRRH